jgi:hypothetical protein
MGRLRDYVIELSGSCLKETSNQAIWNKRRRRIGIRRLIPYFVRGKESTARCRSATAAMSGTIDGCANISGGPKD